MNPEPEYFFTDFVSEFRQRSSGLKERVVPAELITAVVRRADKAFGAAKLSGYHVLEGCSVHIDNRLAAQTTCVVPECQRRLHPQALLCHNLSVSHTWLGLH